jgi:hypothetical protein
MYGKVSIGKYLSDNLAIESGLEQGNALSPLFFSFALGYAIRKDKENQVGLKIMRHISCWSMLMM